MTDAPKPADRKVNPIIPADMTAGEHARNVWCCTCENAVRPGDLANPSFYANVASKLRIGDHLEIMPQDGSWWVHLIVRNVERGTAKVGLIQAIDFEDAAIKTEDLGDVEIKWRGPKLRFGVVRKSDDHVLQENLPTKQAAMTWAMEHERNFAA